VRIILHHFTSAIRTYANGVLYYYLKFLNYILKNLMGIDHVYFLSEKEKGEKNQVLQDNAIVPNSPKFRLNLN